MRIGIGLWCLQSTATVPRPFIGKADQIEAWHDVQMPGHFALQGHEKLGREQGDAVAFFKLHRLFCMGVGIFDAQAAGDFGAAEKLVGEGRKLVNFGAGLGLIAISQIFVIQR